MTATEFARSLHKLAAFYKANPSMPVPYVEVMNLFVCRKGDMIDCARMLGSCDKVFSNEWFELQRMFGSIKLTVNIERTAICERVKVGEREVPEQHLPAKEAETIPAHTEEVYEWKCPEALLSMGHDSEQLPASEPVEAEE